MPRPIPARRPIPATAPGSSRTTNPPSRGDVRHPYAEVTDQIIAALEAGTPPWRKPWDTAKVGNPVMPRNATTGANYRGINVVTLGMSPLAFVDGDPRWATYRQAAERGWQVRRGACGTTAFFYKRIEVAGDHRTNDSDPVSARPDDSGGDDEATRHIPLMRRFTLFHASQIDGIPAFVAPTVAEAPWRAPAAAETIVANSGADIRIGGNKAFYAPSTDHIQMPRHQAFATAGGWTSTVLHELCHWTSAPHRLDRDLRDASNLQDYAREELRAELAQVMVSAELGLPECDFANAAAYIAIWLERLRSDRREIFRAAADAQRIADYLLAFHPDWASRIATQTASDPIAAGAAVDTAPVVPSSVVSASAGWRNAA